MMRPSTTAPSTTNQAFPVGPLQRDWFGNLSASNASNPFLNSSVNPRPSSAGFLGAGDNYLYGQRQQPSIQHASLQRVHAYKTRDLIESHSARTGKPRLEIVQELNRQAYSTRSSSAIPEVSTSTWTANPLPSWGRLQTAVNNDALPLSIEAEMNQIYAQKSAELAAESRFRANTKLLVDKWDTQNARFEAESIRKAEYSMLSKQRAQTAPKNRHESSGSYSTSLHKVSENSPYDGSNPAGPRPSTQQHYQRSAYSAEVIQTRVEDGEGMPARIYLLSQPTSRYLADKNKKEEKFVESTIINAWNEIQAVQPLGSGAARVGGLDGGVVSKNTPLLAKTASAGVNDANSVASNLTRTLMSPLRVRPPSTPLDRIAILDRRQPSSQLPSVSDENAVSFSAYRSRPSTSNATSMLLPPGGANGGLRAMSASALGRDRSMFLQSPAAALGVLASRPSTAARASSRQGSGMEMIYEDEGDDEFGGAAVIDPHVSAHVARSVELVQVDSIRSSLTRHGVHVPLGTLERALVTPSVILTELERKMLLHYPSNSLLPNPFAVKAEIEKPKAKKVVKKTKKKKA